MSTRHNPATHAQLICTFDKIECALRRDWKFLRRWRALERASTLCTVAVFLLLSAGAVLLTTGLATRTLIVWCAGITALLLSFLVDRTYNTLLRRPAAPSSHACRTRGQRANASD